MHAQAVLALNLVQIGHFAPDQNREMHRFLRCLLQRRQVWGGYAAQIVATPGFGCKLQQPQANNVGLVGGLVYQAFGKQMCELAMDGASRLPARFHHIGETHLPFRKGDQFQERDGLTECTGVAIGFCRAAGTALRILPLGILVSGMATSIVIRLDMRLAPRE